MPRVPAGKHARQWQEAPERRLRRHAGRQAPGAEQVAGVRITAQRVNRSRGAHSRTLAPVRVYAVQHQLARLLRLRWSGVGCVLLDRLLKHLGPGLMTCDP